MWGRRARGHYACALCILSQYLWFILTWQEKVRIRCGVVKREFGNSSADGPCQVIA